MRLLFALLLLLTTSNPIFGQHHRMDSLQKVAETHPLDTIRLKAYVTLAKWFAQRDSIRTKKYIARGTELAQQLDDEQSKLILQLQRSVSLLSNKQFQTAISNCEAVLEASQAQELPIVQTDALIELGNAYYWQTNYDQARFYLEKGLAISQEINHKIGTARALLRIGTIYFKQKKYRKAHAVLEKALKVCQQTDDKELEGKILNNRGGIFFKQRNYLQTLYFWKRSLAIKQEMENKKGMAATLGNMAMVYKQQGNYAKSRIYYEKNFDIYRQLEDTSGISISLNNLGIIAEHEGNYSQALFYLKRGFKTAWLSKRYAVTANSITLIGRIYIALQNEDSAQYYFRKGIVVSKRFNLPQKLIFHYNRTGHAYTKQGQLAKALYCYFEGLKMAKEFKDTLNTGLLYVNLAEVHETQNNISEAINYNNKALACFQAIDRKTSIAGTKHVIGRLFYQKGEYRKTLDYSHQALRIYHTLQDSCRFNKCLFEIGKAYYALQEIDSAFIVLEKARKQAMRCLNKGDLANIYIELGNVYQTKQQISKAFQSFEMGLVNAQVSQNRVLMKTAAEYLHPLYQQRGQFQKAYEVLNLYQASKDSLFNEENTRSLVQKEMQYLHDQELKEKEIQQLKQENALAQQRLQINVFIGICLALVVVAVVMYRNYRNKLQANQLLEKQKMEIIEQKDEILTQNEELQQQQEEIIAQRDYIQDQNSQITHQHNRIKDSIRYAQTIQQGVLPFEERLRRSLGNHFVLYRPKDIVSGDFYWYEKVANKHFFAVADCTGHGVPGGFMSMLGISVLNDIILKSQIYSPAQILEETHQLIRQILHQEEVGANQDGMDMVLCTWEDHDHPIVEVTVCGAKRPLYYTQKGEVHIQQGIRKSIGGRSKRGRSFSNTVLALERDSFLYLSSDGYADQNGIIGNRKLGKQKLLETLQQGQSLSTSEQQQHLEAILDEHRGNMEQRDDITVVGIQLS